GACGLASGSVFCWGMDVQSTLGTTQPVPPCNVDGEVRRCTSTPLAGPTGFKTLNGSERNYCGIRNDGGAYCWGGNKRGQLGIPSLEETAIAAVFAVDSTVIPP